MTLMPHAGVEPQGGDAGHYCMPPTYHSTLLFLDEHVTGLWGGEWQHHGRQLAPLHQVLDSRSCLPYQTSTSADADADVMDDLGGSNISTIRFVFNY